MSWLQLHRGVRDPRTCSHYTDHRTLENFNEQKHLSRRQARWQELLSQYDFSISYIKGEDNCPADSMSRKPYPEVELLDPATCAAVRLLRDTTTSLRGLARVQSSSDLVAVAAVGKLRVSADPAWLAEIRAGYADDAWVARLLKTLWDPVARDKVGERAEGMDSLEALRNGWLDGMARMGVRVENAVLYVGDRLVVPRVTHLRESIFQLAHDTLGHFGSEKSYAAIRDSFYWPHMRRDIESAYIPSCEQCQRNKSPNRKPPGPLYPLPVPDTRGSSVAIDFIGPLPEDDNCNCIITFTDRVGADVRFLASRTDISAEDLAALFFTYWYCENGLPDDIVSDRDKLFMARFWKALHRLTGVKLKMSTSYHPETDGSSERTNRTLIQSLRFHVQRNQTGWARALPLIRFNYMNTINASTSISPFQLHLGRHPRVLPPFVTPTHTPSEDVDATELAAKLLKRLDADVMEAQDNLLLAKTNQAHHANDGRGDEIVYHVGDKVLLSTFHRRRDYMQRGDNRVAKFMVRFDGPYTVSVAHPETSSYTLDLPRNLRIHPTFHSSLLRPFFANDASLFPSREHEQPGPVNTPDGPEHVVERILDRRRRGRGVQYLVRWKGYGQDHNEWLPGAECANLEALDIFLHENAPGEVG